MIRESTSEAPKGRSRQQRRYDRTREKLLAAARSVFKEKGLSATIDEIAERADVARGSFYYHFKSKEAVIRELVNDVLSNLTEQMNKRCADEEGLEPTLDGIIQAHIGFFSSRWEDFVLYYQGRADLTLDESYDGLEKPFINYVRSIEKLIDASIADRISTTGLRRIANALAGFVAGYYSFAIVSSNSQDIDKEFQSLRTAFVTSLARFARESQPGGEVQW